MTEVPDPAGKKVEDEIAAQERLEIEEWADNAAHENKRIASSDAIEKRPEALALYVLKRADVEAVRDPLVMEWAQIVVDICENVGADGDVVADVARDRYGDEAADEIVEEFENPTDGEEGIAPDHDEHMTE